MIFLQIEELKVRKFQSLIDDVSSKDDSVLNALELEAIEIVKAYLKPRYDTEYIFSRTGLDRNPLIMAIITDTIMCNLWLRTNSNEIPSSLEVKCENNLNFLKDVAKGLISPDLPSKDPRFEDVIMFQGSSETVFNNVDHID